MSGRDIARRAPLQYESSTERQTGTMQQQQAFSNDLFKRNFMNEAAFITLAPPRTQTDGGR